MPAVSDGLRILMAQLNFSAAPAALKIVHASLRPSLVGLPYTTGLRETGTWAVGSCASILRQQSGEQQYRRCSGADRRCFGWVIVLSERRDVRQLQLRRRGRGRGGC